METRRSAERRMKLAPWLLSAVALLLGLLAIFQWVELLDVRHGGHALCGLSAHINCETVWNSPMATRLHQLLGVPVAALGVVWGLVALALALRLAFAARRGSGIEAAAAPVRLTAVAGVGASVMFAMGSFQAHALCLTCLATYLLVLGYGVLAFFVLPVERGIRPQDWRRAVLESAGLTALFFLAVLYPGLKTPETNVTDVAVPAASATQADQGPMTLHSFLAQLTPEQKQMLGEMMASYRDSAVPMAAFDIPSRNHSGNPDAPVHIVDFTDVRCSHCKHLEETLQMLRQQLPGRFSVESRYFPLDGECNPLIKQSSGNGICCAGAKAELCLEQAPDFVQLQQALFENQAELTREKVLEIASSGSVSRDALERCMNSSATQQQLMGDIQYAQLYGISGTPLVLVNGRAAPPLPLFLYAIILANGNPNAPELSSLSVASGR